MNYVSWVFRSYFGFAPAEAERLMLLVHTEGRAVVATGGREEMERHVEAMHDFGLWATLHEERRVIPFATRQRRRDHGAIHPDRGVGCSRDLAAQLARAARRAGRGGCRGDLLYAQLGIGGSSDAARSTPRWPGCCRTPTATTPRPASDHRQAHRARARRPQSRERPAVSIASRRRRLVRLD